MQEMTHVSPLVAVYDAALQAKADTILADADFLSGFQAGIDAYLDTCEDKDRALTNHEAAVEVCRELAPSVRQRDMQAAAMRLYGAVARPLFDSGFLAGWIVAHKTALTDLDDALSETGPAHAAPALSAKILPIRLQ